MLHLKALDEAILPSYQTQGSAGCDVRNRKQIDISPGKVAVVPVGVIISSWERQSPAYGSKLPCLDMRLRSSIALKYTLAIPNGVGTIDADYTGEIGIILYNYGTEIVTIEKGTRIGQLVLNYVYDIKGIHRKDIVRIAGYGSTDV